MHLLPGNTVEEGMFFDLFSPVGIDMSSAIADERGCGRDAARRTDLEVPILARAEALLLFLQDTADEVDRGIGDRCEKASRAYTLRP